jgi:hypothetical protein
MRRLGFLKPPATLTTMHAIDARRRQSVNHERPIILGDVDRAVDPRERRASPKLATVCAFVWALLRLTLSRFARVQRRLSGKSWAQARIGQEINM